MNQCDDPGDTRDLERRGVPEHASRVVLGVLLSALGMHGERKKKLLEDLSAWAENGLERLVGKRGAAVLRRILAVCLVSGAAAALATGALVVAAVRLARGHRLAP